MMKTEYIGNGGFLQRDGMEHKEYAEVCSSEIREVAERDGADLLEKVLDRAYKRVRASERLKDYLVRVRSILRRN